MPRRFLSQAERQRLEQFPSDVSEQDLIVYFHLTPADRERIVQQRTPHTRLGFALLLCSLRYLGFFPLDLLAIPTHVVAHIAEQIDVSPQALSQYVSRAETRWEQLGPVMEHLGFRRPGEADRESLIIWLGERTLEHERPSLLLQLICERLYQLRLVRPGVTTLEEWIADARQWALQRSHQVLVAPLSDPERDALQTLLVPMAETGLTPLTWLRRGAVGYSAGDILDALEKLAFVRRWPVDTWEVSALPPSRLKFLAQIARYTSNQGLQRKKPPESRDTILAAFLLWVQEKTIDELIELYDSCLAEAYRRARRELKQFQLDQAHHFARVMDYFEEMSQVLLDEEVADEAIRATVYQQVPPATLQATLAEIRQQRSGGRRPSHLDFYDRRYSYFRRFTPAFLQALHFHSRQEGKSLLAAVDVLRELNEQEETSQTLEDVPTTFVPSRWRPRVIQRDGRVKRRDYEMCILSELRDALRSGTVWLEGSRRYANLDSYLIPNARWSGLRATYCEMVGMPEAGAIQLDEKQAVLTEQLARFDRRLPRYKHVRLEDGRLVVTPLEREENAPKQHPLSRAIGRLMPPVYTSELLVEVDAWTQFSTHLTHAGGAQARISDLPRHLYAVLLAQACNIDLVRMAALTDLSYDTLLWCANWYIREETLQPATDAMVNFQYQQPLSRYFGDGTFSSSDGQRFAVARKARKATPLPRYFGYGRGLTFLTWTSNQYSQYGTRVTPPSMREATYVLDAILDNETDLEIKEHTTDTEGYTDLVFALFDLLGLQFSPRLRDLGDRNLYCVDGSFRYKRIGPLLSRPIDTDLIVAHWDELLRTAASLKMGWVTASTLISKLQAFPRQHRLTQVLQEYGRLVKTSFILQYLDDEAYRRRILVQLNKGEQVHKLRRFLFFDNLGRLRKPKSEDLVNQAGCLNLLSNAVIVWNTVYMQAALRELTAQGLVVDEGDLEHLSPVRYEHINPYGKFHFDLSVELDTSGLRPLRAS